MSLYSEFSILFPYLKSVRKLEKYLVFDVEFSKVWKLPKKYVNEERVIETKSEDINLRSISFVSEFNEKSVTETIVNIKSIMLSQLKTKYLLGHCSGIPQTHSPHSFHPELGSQREDCTLRILESE